MENLGFDSALHCTALHSFGESETVPTKDLKIGIIGAGPRGLTVLERIIAHERTRKSACMQIYLFDPHSPGAGCHHPDQPDHLLVNTVAGQITLFSDSSVKGAGPMLEGPSFYQWLQDRQSIQFLEGTPIGAMVSSDEYYSRGQFGLYLRWAYLYLQQLAPLHVKIYHIGASVLSASPISGNAWSLETGDGSHHTVDYLFMTTGHTKPKSVTTDNVSPCSQSKSGKATTIHDPYPIKQTLSFIQQRMTVAIEGMGLTTFDVLAELTIGRGGRFMQSPVTGKLKYQASGHEPVILAFSRSGVPLNARAINQKGISGQYRPRFLTIEAVRELRQLRKLEFATDILPLLLADMEYAYYDAYLTERKGRITAMLFCNYFFTSNALQRQFLVAKHIPAEDHFSWEKLAAPTPKSALTSRVDFRLWMNMYLRKDLEEAMRGNVSGPLKAAADVLRDLRDNLRAAIDFGGLTEASHRWLYAEFVPVMNRIAVGPPKSRIEEMLALIDAGVLIADWGPNAYSEVTSEGYMQVCSRQWPDEKYAIDVLIKARISMHSPCDDSSPLIRNLLDAGLARPFYNSGFHPGGLEVDHNFNLVSKTGLVINNAWALGVPTEGAKFYTFVVPRPGVNSTAIVDAGRAVGKMLMLIAARTSPPAPRLSSKMAS